MFRRMGILSLYGFLMLAILPAQLFILLKFKYYVYK